MGSLAAGLPLTVTVESARPGIDVISGGERLDELAGLLLSRHRSGHAVADVLAEPLSQLLETHNYDLVIIDSPPGGPNLQLLALGAARWLIIPTRGTASSLKGMVRIVQRHERLGAA